MSEVKARLIEIRDDQKALMEISERAKNVLQQENRIKIGLADAIPTIVYAFLRETINYLNRNKTTGQDIEVNLMQLMDIGITYRESDGEKEGNFTPFITPGQEFKLLVKDDDETEEE